MSHRAGRERQTDFVQVFSIIIMHVYTQCHNIGSFIMYTTMAFTSDLCQYECK